VKAILALTSLFFVVGKVGTVYWI